MGSLFRGGEKRAAELRVVPLKLISIRAHLSRGVPVAYQAWRREIQFDFRKFHNPYFSIGIYRKMGGERESLLNL